MKFFRTHVAVSITVIALVGAGVWFFAGEREASPYDAFAQCLSEKKAVMYGAYWCPHCQDQKELFSSSFARVPYVECAIRGSQEQAKACKDAGITGYPTWIFADGERRSGFMPLEDLSQKTGCALP